MSILIGILLTLHVAVCLLLVLIVLMQRPRSEGLGAAFGGGVTDNIFGAQTTNVLSKFTVWLGVAFFVLTLVLAVAYSRLDSGKTPIQRELMAAPVPIESATPAGTTPEAAATPEAQTQPEAAATPETAPAAAPAETAPSSEAAAQPLN